MIEGILIGLKTALSFQNLLICLLYTSDAADDTPCVDLGGRRIIKAMAVIGPKPGNIPIIVPAKHPIITIKRF